MFVLLEDRWELPGPGVWLAVSNLDSDLLSFAIMRVGVGTQLLYEPKEGGFERGDGAWSAVHVEGDQWQIQLG